MCARACAFVRARACLRVESVEWGVCGGIISCHLKICQHERFGPSDAILKLQVRGAGPFMS